MQRIGQGKKRSASSPSVHLVHWEGTNGNIAVVAAVHVRLCSNGSMLPRQADVGKVVGHRGVLGTAGVG